MHYWKSIFINWQKAPPENWDIYVCKVRPSRHKALVAAVYEHLSLLVDFQPAALLSGPLAEQKGVYWISTHPRYREDAESQFQHLGYTSEVFRLSPTRESTDNYENGDLVRWRKKDYRLLPIYLEDPDWLRSRAPDKQTFLLMNDSGKIVAVKGYRGDSNELSRRGLPPEDARVLVNLVTPPTQFCSPCAFLDPFAGVGGLLIEAVERPYKVYSGDIDRRVQFGLNAITQRHFILDAGSLPFRNEVFFGIASELPFQVQAEAQIDAFISEIYRVLVPDGKAALMVVEQQMAILEQKAANLQFDLILKENINRKGTNVWIGVWRKR